MTKTAQEPQDSAAEDVTIHDSVAEFDAQPEAEEPTEEPAEEATAAEEDLPDMSAVLDGDEVAVSSEEPQASSLQDEGPDQEETSTAEIIDEMAPESMPESEPDPEPEAEPSSQMEKEPVPESVVAEMSEEETTVHSSNGSNGAFKTFGGAKVTHRKLGTR